MVHSGMLNAGYPNDAASAKKAREQAEFIWQKTEPDRDGNGQISFPEVCQKGSRAHTHTHTHTHGFPSQRSAKRARTGERSRPVCA